MCEHLMHCVCVCVFGIASGQTTICRTLLSNSLLSYDKGGLLLKSNHDNMPQWYF